MKIYTFYSFLIFGPKNAKKIVFLSFKICENNDNTIINKNYEKRVSVRRQNVPKCTEN